MSISVISDCDLVIEGEPLSRLSRRVAWWELKRDVVGCFSLGRVGAIAEHAELPRDDFSPVAFAASVLRFVLAGSSPSPPVKPPALFPVPLRLVGATFQPRTPCALPAP